MQERNIDHCRRHDNKVKYFVYILKYSFHGKRKLKDYNPLKIDNLNCTSNVSPQVNIF